MPSPKKAATKAASKPTSKPASKTTSKPASKPAKSPSKATGKRTLIKPNGDARYIRRNAKGQIKESDDVGRSLKKDREKKAKTTVSSGQGDRGDRKKPTSK
jgi:hypothetical protein